MKSIISNHGALTAANQLGQYVFDAKLAQDIASEFKPQHAPAPLSFLAPPELPHDWKPFCSSLIDTVRVVLNIRHEILADIVERNPNMSRDGFKSFVRSPYTMAVAQVFSFNKCSKLVFEFSVAKFLTGQNLVGLEEMHRGCLQGIKTICKLMGIRPTAAERRAIDSGSYRLTRVDLASHIDCATADRAAAMMFALRNHLVGKGKDIALYDDNTLYAGQHSSRRSFKIYRKDIELLANPMPLTIYGREGLMKKATGLVRMELTLRREELTDRGLDNPLAWTPEVGHALLNSWANRLRLAEGRVPDVAKIDQLTPVLQQKLRAWLYGDAIAFTRDVTHDTYRDSRRRVLAQTGIDVANNLIADQQREAMLTILEIFNAGTGYRAFEHKWDRLVEGVRE